MDRGYITSFECGLFVNESSSGDAGNSFQLLGAGLVLPGVIGRQTGVALSFDRMIGIRTRVPTEYLGSVNK